MSVTESTQKHRNLANDPRSTIVVFHPDSPNYYAFADQLGARYSADMRAFDRPTDRASSSR